MIYNYLFAFVWKATKSIYKLTFRLFYYIFRFNFKNVCLKDVKQTVSE